MQPVRQSKSVRNESKLLRRAGGAAIAEMLERRQLLTTIVVNSTSDAPVLFFGAIDLRIAINRANAATSSTTISFDPSVFGSPRTIDLAGTALELSNTHETTTITGPSAALTINAGYGSGVLAIDSKVKASMTNLSLNRGSGSQSDGRLVGGGIYNLGTVTLTNVHIDNNNGYTEGGGIYNTGTLTLTNGSVSGDSAEGGGGIWNLGTMTLKNVSMISDGAQGEGAIANFGKMTLTDMDISYNTAGDDAGVSNDGTMTMTNVTVSNNSTYEDQDSSFGGAAGIGNTKTLTMINCTIVGNTAGSDTSGGPGGGINNTGTLNIGNSIVASNTGHTGRDVHGTVKSLGHNLIGNPEGSSGWKSSDITGTFFHPIDPQLGALANNGGSTETMLPLAGSPAINAGSNSLIPSGITTDQRGDARISDSSVDIGAVEVQFPTMIAGTVFNDANKNDKKDSGEAELAGWEVYDDANNNGKLDSGETLSFTTSTGSYGLGILGTGTAHIREIVPANWSQTTPSNNGSISITLNGGSHTDENFGDHTSIKYLSTVATTSGIVGWWTFDSASQANSILNGYTGGLKGGATISSNGGAPIKGESSSSGLSLNGTSAFVNTNLTTQQEFTKAGTFNAWIDLGSTPAKSGHVYSIMAKSQVSNDLDLQIETDGSVHFYTDNGSSTSYKPSSLTGWHMITAEFDTSAKIRKIFWDGKQVASSTPGSHSSSTGTFAIGESDVFTGRFFDGKIDEVTLFNDALSSSQISAIYNASK